MRLLLTLTLAFVLRFAAAQDNQTSADNPLAVYPTCAQKCLQDAFTTQPFCPDPSDSACACNDPGFGEFVHVCVIQGCTLRDALVTENVTIQLCNQPSVDRSSTLTRETAALLTTTCLLVLARVLFKIFGEGQNLWWDDYLLVFLLLTGGIPNMVITMAVLVPNGIGRDFWTLSFDQITNVFKWNYIEAALYFPQVAALKCVFLFFFLRIFTTHTTRRVINYTIIVTLVWGAASTLVAIFECWPIPYYWVWDGSPGGWCMDKNDVQLANAVISIVLDVWMLAIPLWSIRKLKMAMAKKVAIAIMFVMGGFVTIVSCIRLKYLRDVVHSENPTQTLFDIIRWSTIEGNTSIYCACMPMMRAVLLRFFPRTFGTERSSGKRTNYYRIFSGKKSTGTGDSSQPQAGVDSAQKNSHFNGVSSTGGSTGGKRGFWTRAMESTHRDEEEDVRSLNRAGDVEASEPGIRPGHGSNILYTSTYEVDYDRASQDTRTDIMMSNLPRGPMVAGSESTHKFSH